PTSKRRGRASAGAGARGIRAGRSNYRPRTTDPFQARGRVSGLDQVSHNERIIARIAGHLLKKLVLRRGPKHGLADKDLTTNKSVVVRDGNQKWDGHVSLLLGVKKRHNSGVLLFSLGGSKTGP